MAVPREKPYVLATWLPKLLTGANTCEWAVCFKAHHRGPSAQMPPPTPFLPHHVDADNEDGEELNDE